MQLTVYILIIIFFLPKNLEILKKKKDDPKNRLYINQLFCYWSENIFQAHYVVFCFVLLRNSKVTYILSGI